MGKSRKLKNSLQTQQSRLENRKKAEQSAAVQLAQHKAKKNRRVPVTAKPAKPTIPFRSTDSVLLVGEGDFSFTRALISNPPSGLEFLPPQNITTTCYDSEEETYAKYSDAKIIVTELRNRGCQVYFGVDATKLETHSALKNRRFDRVVWNFPHAGKGIADQDRNILSNQLLILGFLRSAASVLREGPIPRISAPRKRKLSEESEEDSGEETDGPVPSTEAARGTVLITLRNVPPYTLWDVPNLAKNPPATSHGPPNRRYMILRSFVFHRDVWKGYKHQLTKGGRAYGTGQGEDRTWELYKA